jgi:hypothetical protein
MDDLEDALFFKNCEFLIFILDKVLSITPMFLAELPMNLQLLRCE